MSPDNGPLSEAVLLILTSLAPQPRHGYAILKDIEFLSDGRVRLGTGTLYGALRRLLEDHWIERHQARAERDRQDYRLTATGRAVLAAEAERLQTLAKTVRTRLQEARA